MNFVHELEVALSPNADGRAIGGAITVELCGHWEHEPPCTYPHHTAFDQNVARVVFTCNAADEATVRERIVRAIRTGRLTGPDGVTSEWSLVREGSVEPTADEKSHEL